MKTNETKHTPGPWEVAYGCVYSKAGDCVAKADRHESNLIPPTERDANIAFIVDACNNYERIKAERDELLAGIMEGDVCEAWCKLINASGFERCGHARCGECKVRDKPEPFWICCKCNHWARLGGKNMKTDRKL